ncbi:hypothetical protein AB0E88_18105 [Streptomyces sp. NPDC028635]|uniref:hypothetical protein n=1 Tax=Streptomyces sp. NPDC028635 TaxID=3154800 RepID=UPI0033DC75C1
MAEITGGEPGRTCEVRQTIPRTAHSDAVRAVEQYRRHIAELSGFARARCPSDAD